jgi:hypothetical protein
VIKRKHREKRERGKLLKMKRRNAKREGKERGERGKTKRRDWV